MKEIEEYKKQVESEKFLNNKIEELVKNNPILVKENEILEVEYNLDGTKKDIYSLASEKDIKDTQIKSDLNEIEYKYYQKIIDSDEFNKRKKELEEKLYDQTELYNDLIFNIINNNEIEEIKSSIKKYNLNEVDLRRLASAITSVTDKKIDDFVENNKKFMKEKIEFWNYKYSELSKAISKSREVESFILNLI